MADDIYWEFLVDPKFVIEDLHFLYLQCHLLLNIFYMILYIYPSFSA